MPETITFDLIRKIQREESRLPKLSKLPDNFFENVRAYLAKKREVAEKKGDRMASIEVRNVERLIENVYTLRERKILKLALAAAQTRIPAENLTEEEKSFFDEVVNLLKARKENFQRILSRGEEATLVVFKEDVPSFVAIDGKTYGPFKKGDIAKLPEENVKVLKEKGVVEEFKVSK